MFGYVRPYRPELTLRQDALYKAHYCGVCHALSAYGLPMRALLRYDLAFLSIVRCGLADEEPLISKRLCPARLRKLPFVDGEAAELCAGLHILLTMEKIRDDSRDRGAAAALKPFVCLPFRKAEEKYAALQQAIERMDHAQQALEEKGCDDPDLAAEPFSLLCGELFSYGAEAAQAPALRWMGENIGRWIYWVDALDDYRKDREKGRYNVLLQKGFERRAAAEKLLPLLSLCADQALAAWDSLDVRRNDAIVRNVLEKGLFHMASSVAEERREMDGPL